MLKLYFLAALFAAATPSLAATETVIVRAVATDPAWKKATDADWIDRIVAEVKTAVKDGADAIVFAEGFSTGRRLDVLLPYLKTEAGPDRLIVLGNAPYQEPGKDYAVSRAQIYSDGAWVALDKLDPEPSELSAKPQVRPGTRLILFRFRGGLIAALPAYSLLKPEIAASLKKRGVALVLVTAPEEDEDGRARTERVASGRAAELGAAVVVASPAKTPALYLPAQKGFDLKPKAAAGRDVRIPWKKLLEIRTPDKAERRPFLDPVPGYQTEI
ncbi:MAG: hypothetical protein HY923_09775 [Elusimicrobia bacterium]|nr:hypothetical protein [Elusimicrobiota bacterium]